MSSDRNLSGCQIFKAEAVPAGWDCEPLGNRIELAYGKGLKEEDRRAGSVDVYGSNGRVGSHDVALVDGPGILVGRKGTVGAVHFAPRAFWPIDTVYYVVPHADDDLHYLRHLLDYLPLGFLNAATGVPGLSRRDAYALRGAFPEPDEQAAIARILDAVDTAIERARTSAARARDLHDSLLRDLMQRGVRAKPAARGNRPTTWNFHRLDEVADVDSGLTLGKDVSGFKSVELPYLRVANVQDGRVDLSTIKTVRVRITDVDKYRLEAGDVLMTEGGDIDKLGRGTLWEGQISDCLHQNHVFRIRTNRKLLDPAFYALVVESDIAKRYFTRVAKRTTNLASTNKTQVRAFRFPVPPTLREQEEIVGVMTAAKATVAGLVAKQDALSNLKKSLMADLLTGRVRLRTTTEEVAA